MRLSPPLPLLALALLAACGPAAVPSSNAVECTGTFRRDGVSYSVRHATRTQEGTSVYTECQVGGDSGALRQEAVFSASSPDAARSPCLVSTDTTCSGAPGYLSFSVDAQRLYSTAIWNAPGAMDVVVRMPCHEQQAEPAAVEWR